MNSNPCWTHVQRPTQMTSPLCLFADWSNLSSFSGNACRHTGTKGGGQTRWRSAMKQEIYSVFSKSPHLRALTAACMSKDKWETYSETEDRADTGKDTGGTRRYSLRGGGRGSRALLGRFTNLNWNKTRQLFFTKSLHSFPCLSTA